MSTVPYSNANPPTKPEVAQATCATTSPRWRKTGMFVVTRKKNKRDRYRLVS